MKINYWKPTISTGIVKATIHQSGKLGFSKAAIERMTLNQNKYIMIGTNKESKEDKSIYLRFASESDENAVKVNKAGQYFYLNTKDFFNEIGVDYKKKSVIYDIVEIIDGNIKLFKLIPRERDRKKKK